MNDTSIKVSVQTREDLKKLISRLPSSERVGSQDQAIQWLMSREAKMVEQAFGIKLSTKSVTA